MWSAPRPTVRVERTNWHFCERVVTYLMIVSQMIEDGVYVSLVPGKESGTFVITSGLRG